MTAPPEWWDAPTAPGPLAATVSVPGSKSVTNRALVLAALADSPSLLLDPLVSRDTDLMAAGLLALGVGVVTEGPAAVNGWSGPPAGPGIAALGGATWRVEPSGLPLLPHSTSIDVGNAGTVTRFLPPVACLAVGATTFDGDPRIRERPVGPLLDALRTLGAGIDDGGRGRLPVTVVGRGSLPGGAVDLDASSSSQLVSALLLAGPRFDAGVTVRHRSPTAAAVPSAPHLAMTVEMLRAAGARIEDPASSGEPDRWVVHPGPLTGRTLRVEPDLSNAAPFLAAALVVGGTVTLRNWPAETTQPGGLLPGILAELGATVRRTADGLAVTGTGTVRGADLDLSPCSELAPTIAALAVFADRPTCLRGIAHMRRHETDRLAALARELSGLGARVSETADGLLVVPGRLHGGDFSTYDDHRLATAAALVGLGVPGVRVRDVATTAKTMPDFPDRWIAMVAGAGTDSTGTDSTGTDTAGTPGTGP